MSCSKKFTPLVGVPHVHQISLSQRETLSQTDCTEQISLDITSHNTAEEQDSAYITEILGGVVHKTPNQAALEKSSLKQANTFRRRQPRYQQRPSSLYDPLTISEANHLKAAAENTYISPLAKSSMFYSTPRLNTGVDTGLAMTIFSDPTDVVVEGKAIKQVTVLSGTEYSRISRKGVLRTSGKKTRPDLLVPCFELKDPEIEGWISIFKQGGRGLTLKNWRRRWFVLKDGKLYYYKTSFDLSACGMISLPGYTIEQALEMNKRNAFKAKKQGEKRYYFFTDTAAQMLRWMDALTKASTIPIPTDQENSAINQALAPNERQNESHSMSPNNQEQALDVTTLETAEKPVIAYETVIIGGVVHRFQIQEDTSLKKTGSFRRKSRRKQRPSSASDPFTVSEAELRATESTPTNPLATIPVLPSTQPLGLNEEKNEGKSSILSDPTRSTYVDEGKVTKQVPVSSSGTENSRVSRKVSGKNTKFDLLLPSLELKDPDFVGWVSKLGTTTSGPRKKKWKRRWFVLKDEKLYCYKTSLDILALEIISLSGYIIEQALELKEENAFKATKQGERSYYLFTDTAEEMLRWMDVLTKASKKSVPASSANPETFWSI